MGERRKVRITGIDPGKTTGWATITVVDKKITLGLFGETKDQTLVEIVDELKEADVIVYEGYWIRPDKLHAGSFDWQNVPAEQTIGGLLTLAKLYGKKTVKQQPSQRVPGYAFAGLNYQKTKKKKHYEDALAHAVFYAVKELQAHPVTSHART